MIKFVAAAIFLTGIVFNMNAQEWKTPVIDGYGRIAEFEDVAIKPDPQSKYKILFNITSEGEREGVNTSLWKIARLINLLESSKVPKKNIHIVAVISGPASPIVLTGKAYQERFHTSNPNLDLMKKLSDYGVEIHLCGQAAAERTISPGIELNPYTQLTLSALTDIAVYQKQGYVIMF